MRTAPLLSFLTATLSACASRRSPAQTSNASDVTARAPAVTAPPSSAADAADPASPDDDARVDANLLAMLGQGTALADHIGPERARAVYGDLDQRPSRYLARLEALLRDRAPSSADTSLFYEVVLWRLRAREPERTAHVAFQVMRRLRTLEAQTPPADDAGFRIRLARRIRGVGMVRDGVDVTPGADWRRVEADQVCVTAAPDNRAVFLVTRGCTCGEPLACRATVNGTRVDIELRLNQNAPGVCTDCYPGYAACSVPTLPAGVPNPFASCADEFQ